MEAGYGRSYTANIIVRKTGGLHSDLGFRFNETTKQFEMIAYDYDQSVANKIKQAYAWRKIKQIAEQARRQIKVIKGSTTFSGNQRAEKIVVEVSA